MESDSFCSGHRRVCSDNYSWSRYSRLRSLGLFSLLVASAGFSWSATSLDALAVLTAVSFAAAGLLVREGVIEAGEGAPAAGLAAVSLTCLLCGMALLLALTGTGTLDGIRDTLTANYQPVRTDLLVGDASQLATVAVVFLVTGVAMPLGLFPFHFPLLELFDRAAGWKAGAVAMLVRLQGLALLTKLLEVASIGSGRTVEMLTGMAGAATCVAAAILLSRVESVRQMAAHGWMLSGGLVMLAFSVGVTRPASALPHAVAGVPTGTVPALALTVIGLLNCTSLLALDARLTCRGRRPGTLSELTGAGRQTPVTGGLLAASLVSVAGIPPSPLFWGLLLVAAGVFIPGLNDDGSQQQTPGLFLLIAAMVTGGALAVFMGRVVLILGVLFHQEPLRRLNLQRPSLPLLIAASCVALLVLIGLQPSILFAAIAFLKNLSLR